MSSVALVVAQLLSSAEPSMNQLLIPSVGIAA